MVLLLSLGVVGDGEVEIGSSGVVVLSACSEDSFVLFAVFLLGDSSVNTEDDGMGDFSICRDTTLGGVFVFCVCCVFSEEASAETMGTSVDDSEE